MIIRPRALFPLLAVFTTLAAVPGHAVLPTTPQITVVAYTGEQDPNEPAGYDYLRFFTPEVGPFLAVVSPPSPAVTGTDSLDVGGLFSGIPGAILSAVTQPSGDALLASFKPGDGGITSADNVALLYGELNYAPDVKSYAQTGTPLDDLPPGVTIRKFMTLDGNGDPIFFATLQGAGVTSANSLALCTFDTDTNTIERDSSAAPDTVGAFPDVLNVLVRVGDSVVVIGDNKKTVKTITSLIGSKGTLAQGRWRSSNADSGESEVGVLLTFTDGSQALDLIPVDASNSFDWTQLPETGLVSNIDGLDGFTITSFGTPAFDVQNTFAVLANLKLGTVAESGSQTEVTDSLPEGLVVSSANDVALILGRGFDTPYVLARKGDSVTADANGNPLTGVTISGLSDPVVGDNGSVAFMITMAGRSAAANTGIEFYDSNSEELSLLANAGASAPGTSGTASSIGQWASFSSLVLPSAGGLSFKFTSALAGPDTEFTDEAGPIFVATLAPSSAADVNATNNLGLWAVNGEDELQLLFRTGQTVTVNSLSKTVRTFVALAAAPGSVGAVSGYDSDGDVAVLATFTDGTKALLDISIPEVGEPDL